MKLKVLILIIGFIAGSATSYIISKPTPTLVSSVKSCPESTQDEFTIDSCKELAEQTLLLFLASIGLNKKYENQANKLIEKISKTESRDSWLKEINNNLPNSKFNDTKILQSAKQSSAGPLQTSSENKTVLSKSEIDTTEKLEEFRDSIVYKNLQQLKFERKQLTDNAFATLKKLEGHFSADIMKEGKKVGTINFKYDEITRTAENQIYTKGFIEIVIGDSVSISGNQPIKYDTKDVDKLGYGTNENVLILYLTNHYIQLTYSEILNAFAGNIYSLREGELVNEGTFSTTN